MRNCSIQTNHRLLFLNIHLNMLTLLTLPFSIYELYEEIRKQPNNKATGNDGVAYEALKQSFQFTGPFLSSLINTCWNTGTIPDEWKLGLVMPIFKRKGQKNDPTNYRGITLLSCLLKTYTGLIYERLYKWTETYRLLPPNQFGFRRGYSTLQAVTHLVSNIKSSLASIGRYYVCFVDFKKAFDSIDRQTLLLKLLQMGIGNTMGNVLLSILKDNVIKVLDGNLLSNEIITDLGVPQGDKLSPLLFSLFIADLSRYLEITGCNILFYADDLAIGSKVIDNIQWSMDILQEYCLNNSLIVNIEKTQVVKLRYGGPLAKGDNLTYQNQNVEFVNNFCYLGVILTPRLSVNRHLQFMKTKAINSVNSINARLDLSRISLDSGNRLLTTVVMPCGTYGCEIFDDGGNAFDESFTTHQLTIIGYFWKKWCKISYRYSSRRLIEGIYYDDHLKITSANLLMRRIIAIYYCNGLHHGFCRKENCYGPQDDGHPCICDECGENCESPNHLEDCLGLKSSDTLKKLRLIYDKIESRKTPPRIIWLLESLITFTGAPLNNLLAHTKARLWKGPEFIHSFIHSRPGLLFKNLTDHFHE